MTKNSTAEQQSQMEEGHSLIVERKSPDQVLAILGEKNPLILYIWLTMGFVWALDAMPIMCGAFLLDNGCSMGGNNRTQKCTPENGTVEADFRLDSGQRFLVDMTSTSFVLGQCLGSLLSPYLSDRLGRRPLLLLGLAFGGGSGCLSAFSPDIFVFIALRFVQGLAYSGLLLTNWVLAYESIPLSLRSATPLAFGVMWVVGYVMIAPIAYLTPNWRYLMFAVSIPSLLCSVLFYFTVPESLHFLVLRKQAHSIEQWLKSANRAAGWASTKQLSSTEMRSLLAHVGGAEERRESVTNGVVVDSMGKEQRSYEHAHSLLERIMANRKMLLYVTIFCVLWTCDGFIYYGLSLFSTALAGDRYLNFTLVALVELPSYLLSPRLLDSLGRRLFTVINNVLAAVAFFVACTFSGIRHPAPFLCLWLICKFAIASSFTGIFVYASEVYPTKNRSLYMGICTTFSLICTSLLAPSIRLIEALSPIAPLIFFGGCSSLAMIVPFLLPETKGRELPD